MSELFESDNRSLRERWAYLPLDEFSMLELSGEDRIDWLQGQATNDVRNLAQAGNRASFCFCEPTGGLVSVMDAWSLEDRILIVTPKARLAAVLERIEKMTIIEDVEARETGYHGISIQGPLADEVVKEYEGITLRSDRTPYGGWDVWQPVPFVGERTVLKEVAETARLEAGIPKWDIDMGVKTLAPEMGPAFESCHVSYNKGCYTGQEILMRIHARGHTNRTWVGLLGIAELKVGDSVTFEGKPVGTVTSAAYSPKFGHIAAASLRNEATTEGQKVVVGETEAEVRQMPILRSV
jgi:folate-binding protein YgfZ